MRPETKYYFSIKLRETAGLADRLTMWRDLYLLGCSLGWTHVYQPLRSDRSDPDSNIFDFLGVNDLSQTYSLDNAAACHIRVIRHIVSRGDIGMDIRSAEDLRAQIMSMVQQRLRTGRLRYFLALKWRNLWQAHCAAPAVLIQLEEPFASNLRRMFRFPFLYCDRLRIYLRRRVGLSINSELKKRQLISGQWLPYVETAGDIPDRFTRTLQRAYDNAEARSSWPSKFEEGKIKVLVHIRLGDFAVIRAPWGKFLTALQPAQFESREDIGGRDGFEPREYLPFLKELSSCAAPDMLSIITASDGYDRAFAGIYGWGRAEGRLSAEQVRYLKEVQGTYQDSAFEGFSTISQMVVGENSDNLRHTLTALMQADIILSSSTSTLPKVIMDIYRRSEKSPPPPPLHIALYRDRKFVRNRELLYNRWAYPNILLVDIAHPDFKRIKMRVREHMQAADSRAVHSASAG